MPLSVVILSKTWSNLLPCVQAIRRLDPELRICVVDDGLPPNIELSPPSFKTPGAKPFVFARNANLGIEACGDDDIVLLNDDAILRTAKGFSRLHTDWSLSASHFGLVSSSLNFPPGLCGNEEQLPVHPDFPLFRKASRPLSFVAVLIPRATFDAVGPLDERFVHYGFEDNDYCDRVRRAGYRIAVYDGCFVDHSTLRSTFRSQPDWELQMELAARTYQLKQEESRG